MKNHRVGRIAQVLVFCLIFSLAMTPVSAGAQSGELLSYEDAIARLNSVSLTDEEALALIYRSFDAVGARNFAPQYKYLTAVLLELCSNENADFASIDAAIALLGQNGAFIGSYAENEGLAYLSLGKLQGYTQARKLEAGGDYAQAYLAYMESQILDSLDRAMALTLLDGTVAAGAATDEAESPDAVAATPDAGGDGDDSAPAAEGGTDEDPGQTPTPAATPEPTTEPTPEPEPWPTYTLTRYSLNPIYPDDKVTRVQARTGPSKNYSEAGAYKTLKMSRTDGLFVEGSYVLVDMNYPTVGVRRVYLPKGAFHNTYTVPETTLPGYPR